MLKKHKIYILYTGLFCKIGVTSRNIEDRIKEIQTNCPLPIYAYRYFGNLSKGNAYHIESKLKEHLSKHLSFGEWYKQFPNIKKSVSYLIQQHTCEDFNTRVIQTKNNRFEDISIRKLNEIKKLRTNNDLDGLSHLYTNLVTNKKDYCETRFFMYSKKEVIGQLEIAIRNTIGYYKNNKIEISKNTESKLTRTKNKRDSEWIKRTNSYELEKVNLCKVKIKNKKQKMEKVISNYPFLFKKD